MATELGTFEELYEHVEENFGGEAVNPGRGKEILISIPLENFDEDEIYDFLPEWSGKWTDDEAKVNYIGEVIIYSGLVVDLDGSSLILKEDFGTDVDDDEEEDGEEGEWTENDGYFVDEDI